MPLWPNIPLQKDAICASVIPEVRASDVGVFDIDVRFECGDRFHPLQQVLDVPVRADVEPGAPEGAFAVDFVDVLEFLVRGVLGAVAGGFELGFEFADAWGAGEDVDVGDVEGFVRGDSTDGVGVFGEDVGGEGLRRGGAGVGEELVGVGRGLVGGFGVGFDELLLLLG